MKPEKITFFKDSIKEIKTNFTLLELKMIFNACNDIVTEYPMMLGYKKIAKKIKDKIK